MLFSKSKARMPEPNEVLPGRQESMPVPSAHFINGHPLAPPFPDGLATAVFAMGCFWGAERKFWQAPGVYTTAVGYAGGTTPNPTYEEVCSGRRVTPRRSSWSTTRRVVSYDQLLKVFWESHDPTQGMRQGNDVGTQYRSAIYWDDDAQRDAARGVGRHVPGAAARRRATARSPRRWRRPGPSTTPSPITSSTSGRTRTGTAGWAAPA